MDILLLKSLDGCLHECVIHLDVALCRGKVLVPSQGHDHFGRHATMRKLGDEPASTAMAAALLDAGFLVEPSQQLA